MAGEITLCLEGNLVSDLELRYTPSGSAVANGTIASTPRTFDANSKQWVDQETLFMRVSIWREMAENAVESLTKGMGVIATGKLKSRSYDAKDGTKRTVIEMDVENIGPSLKWATAQVKRAQRGNQQGGQQGRSASQGGSRQQAGGQGQTRQAVQQEDPWANDGNQNAGQWGNGPDQEPPF